ncbi:MAG: hypothetical protein ABSG91_18550 [Syntrophobacteraceae bacterium]|jgi:hypothetical protein
MKLIFYSADKNDFSSGLLEQVRALVPLEKLVVCRDCQQLRGALLKPSYDLFAAILVASGRQDLLGLISMAELLHSIRVILILPDRETETISKGHALRPRFLTWPAPDSLEIISVLHKMLANVKKCHGT